MNRQTVAEEVVGVAEQQFTVTYDGPALASGRMNVRDLAPALLALADALREAHHEISPGVPDPVLDIRAMREGSFAIELILSEGLLDRAIDLLTSSETQAALNLGALVGGFFGAARLVVHLARRKIRRQDPLSDGGVRITFDDGTTITVPAVSIQIAQNPKFRTPAGEMVAPLRREGVDQLRLDHVRMEPVQVTEADLPGFEIPPMPEEQLEDSERLVALSPVTIAFAEGNKWKVTDGESTFWVTVEDQVFAQRVQAAVESFTSTDILRARLRTRQWRTPEGALRTEHYIEQVVEHVRGPRQIPLPLEYDR